MNELAETDLMTAREMDRAVRRGFPRSLKSAAAIRTGWNDSSTMAETRNAKTPWSKPYGGHGRHYRTCLATLILESYYRFLPTSERK